tara:strand:- start:588 stop:1319 length:732 start_codon:yes stop_codon:yes gene_type:complete
MTTHAGVAKGTQPPGENASVLAFATRHVYTKAHVKIAVQLVLFAFTIYISYSYWSTPVRLCDPQDAVCIQKNVHVSSIIHGTTRIVIVILLVLQVVYALDISITPFLATCGVSVAAFGFTISEPLHDYVMGISMAYTEKLQLYSRVSLLIYGKTHQPIVITNLSPLTLDGVDDDGNTVHVRYSYIQKIEVVDVPPNAGDLADKTAARLGTTLVEARARNRPAEMQDERLVDERRLSSADDRCR